jgi:GntR family transcriptional regulator, arabinose operon transcriptional repressor
MRGNYMKNNEHLYEQIVSSLRKKIIEKEFLPNQKVPTEQELCKLFNVSRITAKRALEELEREGYIFRKRGSGSYVAPESSVNVTETKVVNRINNTKIVAMVLPFENTNRNFIGYLRGATDVLSGKGYYLTIHNASSNANEEKRLLMELSEGDVRGIIYYPSYDNKNIDILFNLSSYEYPIVTIDKYYDGIPISSVISDNFTGTYEAISYLIKRGHKKIAYISDIAIESATSLRQRYFGYSKALIDYGIYVDDKLVKLGLKEIGGLWTNEDGTTSMEKKNYLSLLIKDLMKNGVTAIHTINDYCALNLLTLLDELSIKVPEEVSVIGFDNLEIAQFSSIPLTTINQNFYEIGKKAAEVVLQIIESKKYEPIKCVMPVSLIERESCM